MGTLAVEAPTSVPWSQSGDQGPSWQNADALLGGASSFKFVITRGPDYVSDAAVGAVTIACRTPPPLPPAPPPSPPSSPSPPGSPPPPSLPPFIPVHHSFHFESATTAGWSTGGLCARPSMGVNAGQTCTLTRRNSQPPRHLNEHVTGQSTSGPSNGPTYGEYFYYSEAFYRDPGDKLEVRNPFHYASVALITTAALYRRSACTHLAI